MEFQNVFQCFKTRRFFSRSGVKCFNVRRGGAGLNISMFKDPVAGVHSGRAERAKCVLACVLAQNTSVLSLSYFVFHLSLCLCII